MKKIDWLRTTKNIFMHLGNTLSALVVLMVSVLLGAVVAKYLFVKLWGVVFGSVLGFVFGFWVVDTFFVTRNQGFSLVVFEEQNPNEPVSNEAASYEAISKKTPESQSKK